jgi:hypothetical protein
MKLNFWQWLGLVFFVVALALIIWRETSNTMPPASMPAAPAESSEGESPATAPAPTTAP